MDQNISRAALARDPARVSMLHALMDGRALIAGELAGVTGIAQQTASDRLRRPASAPPFQTSIRRCLPGIGRSAERTGMRQAVLAAIGDTMPAVSTTFFGQRVVAAVFVLATFGWGLGFYGPPIYLHTIREAPRLAARSWFRPQSPCTS